MTFQYMRVSVLFPSASAVSEQGKDVAGQLMFVSMKCTNCACRPLLENSFQDGCLELVDLTSIVYKLKQLLSYFMHRMALLLS